MRPQTVDIIDIASTLAPGRAASRGCSLVRPCEVSNVRCHVAADRVDKNEPAQDFVGDPTDEDFARAAEWALRNRNLPLAIQQVSAAIALRPLHAPYLRLLDDVIRATPGPLALVELQAEGAFYGLCAARARVLARVGRLDEAMHAVFQAAAFEPSAPFVTWAIDWVQRPRSARKVQPRTLATGMIALLHAATKAGWGEGAIANVEAALAVAERVAAQHARDDELLVVRSRLLRPLGRHGAALGLLQVEETGAASWEIAIEHAAIHRELGDRDARVVWLTRARDARPEEPSTYLDLGDALLDDGALGESAASYERAIALDPKSDWARLGAAHARALASGAPAIAERATGPRSPALEARARAIDLDLSAYLTRLADPIDPLIAVIRAAEERAATTAGEGAIRMRVRADRPAAPSARVAFELALSSRCREGSLVVEHGGAGARVGPLWRAGASGAEPAPPPPPSGALERAREVASLPFDWRAWTARAATLAAGATEEEAASFERAAAHPPAPPAGLDVVRWVHGFQIAAALLCASAPSPAAERLERLLALLTGPDDWAAAAALLGLRALGRSAPELRAAILDAVRPLLPAVDAPLPPLALALAVLGGDLAEGGERRDFLRLRMRARAEVSPRENS